MFSIFAIVGLIIVFISKNEKLVERFKQLPKDFTFDELEKLLSIYGYVKCNKGKTSGSRIMFEHKSQNNILIHKPHPGNVVKGYALKIIYDALVVAGYISK